MSENEKKYEWGSEWQDQNDEVTVSSPKPTDADSVSPAASVTQEPVPAPVAELQPEMNETAHEAPTPKTTPAAQAENTGAADQSAAEQSATDQSAAEQPVAEPAPTFVQPPVAPPTFVQPPVSPPTFGQAPRPIPPTGAPYAPPMGGGPIPPMGAPYVPPMGGGPMPTRPQTPPPPATTYRWTYAEQRMHDVQTTKKQRKGGITLFVAVMAAVFALSFGLLLGVMFATKAELPNIQFSENESQISGSQVGSSDYADAVAIEKAKQSVVLIEVTTPNGGGSGTGIILSADGYIATNHHVIEDGTSIRVKFYDGTYASAYVRGSSAVDDLAVIKVDRSNLTPATFAHSSDCFVGQTVYAIGNPSGAEMAWTTTKGCISYVNRELKIYHDDGTLEKKLKMIQTDAMVNPGNSGGPLVNTKGEVVGIVSMKLADGYEGIGFAIPSDGASEILNAIIKDGNADNVNSNVSYDRPVIGIVGVFMEGDHHYIFEENRIVEVSDSYAEENPDEVISPKVSGIYVRSLTEGTDAAIKLQPGDIITGINGIEVENMNILMNEINEHYAGDEVVITYFRNNLYTDVVIVLSGANS